MSGNLKNTVIYIVGPTASGKTGLSIELAKRFGGQIICGDSMQIYKDMPIATAVPTKEEKGEIKHRMFEFLSPSESFSVSDYVNLAKKEIEKTFSENKLPIVVGGTGLYISSLAENIDFFEEKSDGVTREALTAKAENEGLSVLYSELCRIDPISAEKISQNDQKRIIRALEVYYISGETMSERAKKSRQNGKIYNNIFIGVNYLNRETLYERINKRVDIMLENGLLKEAEIALKNSGNTASQAIGHKELKAYFDGEVSLEEAIEHLKMQTRRYAKRQITWFSKTEGINWVYMDEEVDSVLAAEKIIKDKIN